MTRNTLLGNLFAILLAGGCSAAELTVEAAPAGNGHPAEVEILLTPDSSALTALQFDVGFNSNLVKVTAIAGPAAIDAHKNLETASAGRRKTRFLIAGLNRDSIPKGVVVRLSVTALGAQKLKGKTMILSNVVGSDGDAKRVQIHVQYRSVRPAGPFVF